MIEACLIGVAAAVVGGSPVPDIKATRVADGLVRPIDVKAAPGQPNRIYVAEQFVNATATGRIQCVNLETGALQQYLEFGPVTTFGPRGLLSFVFDPDYATNGYVYVNYTDAMGTTHLVRYTRDSVNPDVADPTTLHPILSIPQIGAQHNGAWLEFGPDGFLYFATGDGGGGGPDVFNNAQNVTNGLLLGKLLRLDPHGDDFPSDPDRNYAIPADNPFVGNEGNDEILSFGLRHPWRGSFDPVTGDMYITDVGDDAMEEINMVPAGPPAALNFGWRCFQGFELSQPCDPPIMSVDPIYAYYHNREVMTRCAIIGGEVYRGSALPDLQGAYFFADHCSAEIFVLQRDDDDDVEVTEISAMLAHPCDGPLTIIPAFGRDLAGNVYVIARGGNDAVYRIDPRCLGDVDGDAMVDFKDLNLVLEQWGSAFPGADLDCDVDFDDLNLVLANWGRVCGP